ncbi:MAG: S-layer homology domain-containing protein [Clostridiales bacterium]|nr:S-layer homology domain-containing protein [Clostridiales bacterium]
MKKITAALSALLMFGICALAAEFSDTQGHWAQYTIDRLYRMGIVDGMEDSKFYPDGIVTRAQYLKMIMELEGLDTVVQRKGECLDAPDGCWYGPYLQSALDKGLIPEQMIASYKAVIIEEEGRAVYSGAFNGDLPVTREEMAVLTQNVYQYCITYETVGNLLKAAELNFEDKDEISPWALQCVKLTVAEGFMEGMNGNVFDPKATATRAQAATIMGRIIDKLNGE